MSDDDGDDGYSQWVGEEAREDKAKAFVLEERATQIRDLQMSNRQIGDDIEYYAEQIPSLAEQLMRNAETIGQLQVEYESGKNAWAESMGSTVRKFKNTVKCKNVIELMALNQLCNVVDETKRAAVASNSLMLTEMRTYCTRVGMELVIYDPPEVAEKKRQDEEMLRQEEEARKTYDLSHHCWKKSKLNSDPHQVMQKLEKAWLPKAEDLNPV